MHSKFHSHIFRGISQCIGGLGVQGYCLSRPADCPKWNNTQTTQHASQTSPHISDGSPWHAYSKYFNLLTLPNRTRIGYFQGKSKLHPPRPCPFSFSGSYSNLLDKTCPRFQGSMLLPLTFL